MRSMLGLGSGDGDLGTPYGGLGDLCPYSMESRGRLGLG